MSSKLKILGVSDVSVGYGSPQILSFMKSLSEYIGHAESVLLEPDQPEKPPVENLIAEINVKRIYTTFHPHSSPGRVEYISNSTKKINKFKPDILVIFCTYSLPVLLKISYRPRYVIYYAIESTSAYGMFDIELNRRIDKLVDLIIYPEENRAKRDIELRGYKNIPSVILYNCANHDYEFSPLPSDQRNGRILYAGTIDRDLTFADYYLNNKVQDYPIDLYGLIGGDNQQILTESFFKLCGAERYLGYVENIVLARLRKNYAYSIVMWNPINDNFLYAAPNKFFESIFDCVPPIVAPHPQCKELVNRYKCGIVMDRWDYDSFCRSIEQALRIYGTLEYETMVGNCRKAIVKELNWEKQFEKIERFLRI
ncbi:glycosyltransferase [Pelotomaculum isophthalicicum JI]|uniref:Glycosyltransferase n=1 Tax=Pelotomaculum isophthalicicum JI TaxID=947010 RepID=A0A9X4JV94_9FIRM|nr:glycosyltransferase [Pelotomaculum isophthalicicum]MDF9407901.1 glycosyltransferase [Pelotomaculum isophthalicicum JI]